MWLRILAKGDCFASLAMTARGSVIARSGATKQSPMPKCAIVLVPRSAVSSIFLYMSSTFYTPVFSHFYFAVPPR